MTDKEIQRHVDDGAVLQYGRLHFPLKNAKGKFLCKTPPFEVERQAYLRCMAGEKHPALLGAAEHFIRYTNIICHRNPRPAEPVFEWNPNSIEILNRHIQYRFLSCEGSASSGKTRGMAAIGVFNFLASPSNTAVLLTSTTLKDSRHRIWGDVELLWQHAGEFLQWWYHQAGVASYEKWEHALPGELVSSQGFIRYRQGDKSSDKFGLMLISGDKSKVQEGVGKIKGFKAARMFVLLDELADMPEAVVKAVESNIASNMATRVISGQNPVSHFDTGGKFSKPKAGWQSVTVEDDFWETENGACIHFNGEKGPNVLAKKTLYPGLLTYEAVLDAAKRLGKESPEYHQQILGFRCPTGSADHIFCSADIIKYHGDQKAIWGKEGFRMCAGFDPSFAHGGDRAVLYPAKVGRMSNGYIGIEFQPYVLLDHALNVNDSKHEQVIGKLISKCRELNIPIENLAIDITGGGDPLAALIARDWGNGFIRVSFGGKASDIPVSSTDRRLGHERFASMVSELWYAGRDLLRSDQIRGIGDDLALELCQRMYELRAGKIRVESKDDMKERMGRSPDLADGATLAIFAARKNLGLSSMERAKVEAKQASRDPWKGALDWGKPKRKNGVEAGSVWDAVGSQGGGWGDSPSY